MSRIDPGHPTPLSRHTSLGVGGPAHCWRAVDDAASIRKAVDEARRNDLDLFVLGGGTNLLVSDEGFAGMVLVPTSSEVHIDANDGRCRAGAAVSWDSFAQAAVRAGLGGVECMVGIPGLVGAAPVQNIGAYGQELSDVLERVECVDLRSGEAVEFAGPDCEFGYRSSRFKNGEPGRHLITAVELRLHVGAPPCLEYAQLRSRFEGRPSPSLLEAADEVRALRRAKGMLLEGGEHDLRSAGSFFTNPVLEECDLTALTRRLEERGVASAALPRWPVDARHTKCSAAWLIEASGMHPGYGVGRVGLSEKHVLALVNRGQATATEIVDFARHVRDRVFDTVGVRLVPEPVPLGFDAEVLEDLWGHAPATR